MKRLDLGQVASFVALIDGGSFGDAARTLGVAQPTISQHIKRLELQLNTRLIERTPRRSSPTAAGERFLPLARSLLRIDHRARHESFSETRSLGACSNLGVYFVPDVLRDLAALGGSPPALFVGDNPAIAARLASAEVDVALMEWWDGRSGFCVETWRMEPVVAIAPLGHPWGALSAVPTEELTAAPLIGGEPGTGTGRLLRGHFGPTIALPRPVMELGSTEAVKRAVASGMGVSVVLDLTVAREAQRRELVVRPLNPALAKPLCLVRRADIPASDPLVEFLRRSGQTTATFTL